MKTKFNGILTLLLALVVQISFAQEKTVSGKVTDDSGELPGVSILIKGTAKGTDTGFDGKYSIKAKVGDVLVFSYIGYETVEKTVGASNTIDVKLKEGNVLDEVVVTGYTTTTRKKSATSSTQLSAKTVENRPNGNVVQTLAGQVPGLDISTSSGQPGANSLVQLRGVNSINGNTEPLFLLDGVPIDEDNFRSLNQNEIATITVLKDAGATAIYGSRGANGVIVITTKRGKKGSPLKVQYTGILSYSTLQGQDYGLLDSQRYLTLERTVGQGVGAGNALGNLFAAGAPLTDAQIAASPNTDWLGAFLRTGVTQNHTITLTSGGENSSQFTSLGYFEQEAIIRESSLRRFNLRNNINGNSGRFSYGTSVSLNYSFNEIPTGVGGGAVNQNPFFAANNSLPYLTPEQLPTGAELATTPILALTPFFILDKLNNDVSTNEEVRIIASVNANYRIGDNLTAAVTSGIDYTAITDLNTFGLAGFNQLFFNEDAPGRQDQDDTRIASLNTTTSLIWNKTYGKDTFTAGGYTEYFRAFFRTFGFNQQGLNPQTFFPGDGSGFIGDNGNDDFFVDTVSADRLDSGLFSYFATLDWDHDSRFGAYATIRRDASFRFASTNRWGTFWSLSGRWNLDQESWLEDTPFNSLKLRASYGTTGNQNIAGGGLFNAPDLAFDFFGTTGVSFDGNPSIQLAQLGNSDLRWETVRQFNIGVDFAAFDNRLRGSLDYYRKTTVDLFQSLPVSAVTSFLNINSNTGSLENNGFDWQVSYDLVRNNDLRVVVSAVGNVNDNILRDLPSENGEIIGIGRNGGRLGERFEVRYVGVNPANGNLLFLDANDNITENPNPDTDRVWTNKNIAPELQGSFNLNVDYKGFFLTAQLNYTVGVDFADGDYASFIDPNDIGQFQLSEAILRAWTPDNRITDIPNIPFLNPGSNVNDGIPSNRFLADRDFLRLRFLTVGYTVPQKFLTKTGFTNVRIFGNAENLVTWTKFRGFDASSRAQINAAFPTPKIVSLGVELGF